MTWTKLGSEFPEYMAETGVSIAARYTHVELIAYLYRVESRSGAVARGLLRRLVSVDDPESIMDELVAADLWGRSKAGWLLKHHLDVVIDSLDAQEQKRDRDRTAQAKAREKRATARAAERGEVSVPVSDPVSADVYTGSQTDRQTGIQTAATKAERVDLETGEVLPDGPAPVVSAVDPWPTPHLSQSAPSTSATSQRGCLVPGCTSPLVGREITRQMCSPHFMERQPERKAS